MNWQKSKHEEYTQCLNADLEEMFFEGGKKENLSQK